MWNDKYYDELGPVEPRRMRFPVPPVWTQFWEQKDWDAWAQRYGSLEPLVIERPWGTFRAVGRRPDGELVYRLNTEGEV